MKTAISVPDATFERASIYAKKLGMNRSEFFTQATIRYLDEIDSHSLTDLIDQSLELLGEDDTGRIAGAIGRKLLLNVDNEWG